MSPSSLPWEIWQMICRLAILHPDADMNPECPPANPSIDDIHKLDYFEYISPDHAYTTGILLALTSVSKFWNSIATPLLYGNILITKYKSLRSLSHPLQISEPFLSAPSELGARHHYRHTTRLSIVMDDIFFPEIYQTGGKDPSLQTDMRCVDAILGASHNLQYLRIVNFQPDLNSDISSDFGEGAARCIRSIQQLESDTASSIKRPLIAALRGSKSLKTWALLIDPTRNIQIPDISESLKYISLPNLRALHMHSSETSLVDCAATWELSSLCTMTLDSYAALRADFDPRSLMKAHGSTITALHIPTASIKLDALLFSLCPKLQVLAVTTTGIEFIPRIESLTRLDIRLLGDGTDEPFYKSFILHWMERSIDRICDFVESLYQDGRNADFPSLSCIRIVDIPSRVLPGFDPKDKDEEMWRECVQRCNDLRIRFEDSSGVAFVCA